MARTEKNADLARACAEKVIDMKLANGGTTHEANVARAAQALALLEVAEAIRYLSNNK